MKRWMFVFTASVLMVAAVQASAGTDVQLKGLSYSDVAITAVDGEGISFRIFSGAVITKTYDEFVRITLGGKGDQESLDSAERLFSSGKYKEAVPEYTVLLNSKDDTVKTIAKGRLAVANQRAAGGVATKPADSNEGGACYVCHGSGAIPCIDCQGTGLAKCKSCEGSKAFGRVVCPRCNGSWRGDMCKHCGGKGKTSYSLYVGDGMSVIRYRTCMYCDGEGWFNTCACRKEKVPGTIVCPDCRGTGRAGVCPTCNGAKKIACRICKKGLPPVAPPASKPADPAVSGVVAMVPTPATAPSAASSPASTSAPAAKGEDVRFYNLETKADNVVYVIDRSSTMSDLMDDVRQEVVRSISDLNRKQAFHLIFCGDGRPTERTTRMLMATAENKTAEMRFVNQISARGNTEHLSALHRAIDILKDSDGSSCIIFLTDGPPKDSEKLLSTLKDANKTAKIPIHTILVGSTSAQAGKALAEISNQNGGTFNRQ